MKTKIYRHYLLIFNYFILYYKTEKKKMNFIFLFREMNMNEYC
jgi:hypothetical protein